MPRLSIYLDLLLHTDVISLALSLAPASQKATGRHSTRSCHANRKRDQNSTRSYKKKGEEHRSCRETASMRSSSLPLLLLALSGATSLLLPALPRPQTAQPRVATAPHCVIDAPVQKVDSASTTDAAAARNDAANSDVEATSANLLKQMEDGLEAMTSDPQRILEAVVGLPGVARYDRDAIVDYFKQRPALMVTRAVDFLLAFRRIRAATPAASAIVMTTRMRASSGCCRASGKLDDQVARALS